jgi:hypothetical protein
VVPGRVLRYRSLGFRGAFIIEPADRGVRFTGELDFGIRTPGVGFVVDAVLRKLLGRELAAIQTHMREEGQNLKRLLER